MVDLLKANTDSKALFRNIFNMYQNELSQYFDEFKFLDSNGYFDYETVDVYFNADDAILPYIIKENGKIVGMAVLSKEPYTSKGTNYCIQEFFVIGYCRGKGTAEQCCKLLFEKYPGRFCLKVLNENKRAMRFWDRICDKYASNVIKSVCEQKTLYEFAVE